MSAVAAGNFDWVSDIGAKREPKHGQVASVCQGYFGIFGLGGLAAVSEMTSSVREIRTFNGTAEMRVRPLLHAMAGGS